MNVGMHAPAKAKKPRTLSFPSPDNRPFKWAKTNGPVGVSKQAVWKRKVLEQIENGTWVADPKKWESYKTKLVKLDPNFEVCEKPGFERNVKHSRCGSWIVMSLPYDVGRFKTHVNSCSYSTASGGMKTLDTYGILVRPVNTEPAPLSIASTSLFPPPTNVANLPCLGITAKDDIRIAQYMKRTPVNTAGGSNIHDIAEELFMDNFKNLGQQAKDIVRQKQQQAHSWSNDHIRKSVHAIGKNPCDGRARLAKDGSLVPCNQCLALLTLRSFRNAISRQCVESENRGFTPHTFQSPDVGRIYSLGLYELLDSVRTTSRLTSRSTHN